MFTITFKIAKYLKCDGKQMAAGSKMTAPCRSFLSPYTTRDAHQRIRHFVAAILADQWQVYLPVGATGEANPPSSQNSASAVGTCLNKARRTTKLCSSYKEFGLSGYFICIASVPKGRSS